MNTVPWCNVNVYCVYSMQNRYYCYECDNDGVLGNRCGRDGGSSDMNVVEILVLVMSVIGIEVVVV